MLINACSFKNNTGLYCPGCGGTRALIALFKGEFLESICYHPIVIYLVLLAGIYVIRYTASVMLPFLKVKRMRYRNCYVYIGCAIFCINWVVENILWICFDIAIK